jgi:hypothetical protein
MARDTFLLLFGLGVAVTVFRSAYEQIGNTVALWADVGVDKQAGGFAIPMTWFISMNPLCVMLLTPLLLAWWRKREAAGFNPTPTRRMATGALIVGGAYLLLAALSWRAGDLAVGWQWFALFWVVLTFGELFILPTGLGLFARLAPRRLGATTGRLVVPGLVCRQPVGRRGGNVVDPHGTPGLFHPAGGYLRRCRAGAPPDGRPGPGNPVSIDNSLIRTLVSVSE